MAKKSSSVSKVVKKTPSRPKPQTQAGKQKLSSRINTKSESINNNEPKILKVLYKIAAAASGMMNAQSFYKKLHKIISGLMYVQKNFIAMYDEKSGMGIIHFRGISYGKKNSSY